MLKRTRRWLYRHPWLAFVVMGLSFSIFGILSLNLIYLLKSNVELFLDHGTMVIEDGALEQLLELIGYGYLSLAFFLLFKVCEHTLVIRLTEGKHKEHDVTDVIG